MSQNVACYTRKATTTRRIVDSACRDLLLCPIALPLCSLCVRMLLSLSYGRPVVDCQFPKEKTMHKHQPAGQAQLLFYHSYLLHAKSPSISSSLAFSKRSSSRYNTLGHSHHPPSKPSRDRHGGDVKATARTR